MCRISSERYAEEFAVSGRRTFLSAVIVSLAAPSLVRAQTARVYRVGIVSAGGPYEHTVDGLRDGLKELGLEEGKQYVFHRRDTQGDLRAAEAAAKSLEQEKVDLIFAVPTTVAIAAKRATTGVPIVFIIGSDPVAQGLVSSFAKPGGRITGVFSFRTELNAKRLEILKEIAPSMRKVAIFYNPNNAIAMIGLKSTREAAQRLGLVLIEREVRSGDELRASLHALKAGEADALFPVSDATVQSHVSMLIEESRTRMLPAIFNDDSLVAAGGLASYGASYYDMARLAAKYVNRVLNGANPADLPVERSERFVLFLNARTARDIGITIPQSLLLRADEVIQ